MMTKKSFPKIERNKNLLERIHYNIFELNGLLIKEDNDTLSLLFLWPFKICICISYENQG